MVAGKGGTSKVDPATITRERNFIELITSGFKLEASRKDLK
jgi:rRNA processing protein Krr1/Pno1